MGTAVGLGVAVGASSSGLLIDLFGANRAFLVATTLALMAALTVYLFQRTLLTEPESEPVGEAAKH